MKYDDITQAQDTDNMLEYFSGSIDEMIVFYQTSYNLDLQDACIAVQQHVTTVVRDKLDN